MTVRNPLVLVSGLERELPSGDGLILNGPLNMSNQGITSVANPVSTGDAANKSYVDTSTHTINQQTTSSTALTINKITSGTGDLLDIDDDQGLPLVTVNSSGLLTANKSGVVQMASDTTVGLIVKRASTNLNADLQQWQDSTGTVLSFINNNGALSVRSGVVRDAGQFNQAEDTVSNGSSTTPYQMWNPGAGAYHFKSYVDRLETSAVKFAGQNPQNSLNTFTLRGMTASQGPPTSGTWSTNDAVIDTAGVFWLYNGSSWISPNLAIAPVTLTDAATIATNAALGNLFRVTLTTDRTLGVPTNPTDGQRCLWEVTGGSVNCTLTPTTGSAGSFTFGSDITTLTIIAANTTDYIGAIYNASANRWRIISYVKGY